MNSVIPTGIWIYVRRTDPPATATVDDFSRIDRHVINTVPDPNKIPVSDIRLVHVIGQRFVQ